MSVWVIEAKNVNGDRNGIRVYANKEDALADLNHLMVPEKHQENSGDFVETIVQVNDGMYVLKHIGLYTDHCDERAAAVKCEVLEEFQE